MHSKYHIYVIAFINNVGFWGGLIRFGALFEYHATFDTWGVGILSESCGWATNL